MCWHKWAKWETFEEGYLRTEYSLHGEKLAESEKFLSGRFIRQRRICSKCGKLQLRRETDT